MGKEQDPVEKFWKDLTEAVEEEENYEFGSFEEVIEEYPEIVQSKNSGGLLLTEYLCTLEPGPSVRDFLDFVVESGGDVTVKCYENVIHNQHQPCQSDMLLSLINSGFFPLEIGKKKVKTLDAIVENGDDDVFEVVLEPRLPQDDEDADDDDDDAGAMLPRPVVGKTHDEGGAFEEWYEEYRKTANEEEEGSDNESAEPQAKFARKD